MIILYDQILGVKDLSAHFTKFELANLSYLLHHYSTSSDSQLLTCWKETFGSNSDQL